MKPKLLCSVAAAALLALSSVSLAQTQSGSSIGSNTGTAGSVSVDPRGVNTPPGSRNGTRDIGIPSTGTSGDNAGAGGTAPRTPETSVGTSGALGGASAAGPSSGRCDTLIGDERMKCLREQASIGTTK
jgi:hypothetical protein